MSGRLSEAPSAGESQKPDSQAVEPLGEHYLLLVGARASTFTPEKIALFNQSPYDGLALEFTGQYATALPMAAGAMTSKIQEWKKRTSKDIWPWVYVNRMIGRDPEMNSPYGQDPYFFKIHGADLENTTGAQDDFVKIWQNSLRAAKDAKVPGIVADFEFYTNYKAYDPFILAQQAGKTPQETIKLLHQVGVRLADSAAQSYPDAVLWFFFTDLGQLGSKIVDKVLYYPSPAYIVLGLLDEIQEKGYRLKLISGGETGLEYCSYSLDHLKRKIAQRALDFRPHLQKYKGILELGGTMILWRDRAAKSGFVAEGACGKSDAAAVEEQQPYLELLFKTYRYNWIYGTYDPFYAPSAPRFNAVIKRATENARGLGKP